MEIFHVDGGHYQQSRPARLGRALTLFNMEAVMNKLVALFLLLASAWLAGCNTMEGLGRDVERGGEKLQGEARENRR